MLQPVEKMNRSNGRLASKSLPYLKSYGHRKIVPEAKANESLVEPDRRRADTYDELYQSYRRLYPALRARFAETAALTDRLLGHG